MLFYVVVRYFHARVKFTLLSNSEFQHFHAQHRTSYEWHFYLQKRATCSQWDAFTLKVQHVDMECADEKPKTRV